MTAFVKYDLSKQLHYRTLRKHSRKGPWGLWHGSFKMLGLKSLHRGLRCQIDIFQKNMSCVWFLPCWPSSESSGLGHLQYRFFWSKVVLREVVLWTNVRPANQKMKKCCAWQSFSHSQTILVWTRLKPSYVYIYIFIYVHTYTCCTDWQIAIGQSLHSPADVRWSANSVYLFVLLTWSTEIETISVVYLCSFCP